MSNLVSNVVRVPGPDGHTKTVLPDACEVPQLHPVAGSTLCVNAGCGTKKSYRTRQFMQSMPAESRILVLSVRVSHAHDALRELGALGFVAYNDDAYKGDKGRAQLCTERRLIMSLESLHRVRHAAPYDLIVMDEIRTLCGVFGGSTLTRPESIATLKRLYQAATYRMALDADTTLDGAVQHLLAGLAAVEHPIPVHTLVVPKQVLHRTLRVGFKRSLDGLILEALREHQGVGTIAVACGRKAVAKQYAALLTLHGYRWVLYHGDSSRATKRLHFSDPDTHWANADAVIFTSSLSVGVDPRACKFGKIFLHTCPMGATLRDLFQGLCRFGRFEGGLIDTVIDVCLECISPAERRLRIANKTLKALKEPRSFAETLVRVQRGYKANLRHFLDCSNAARAAGGAVYVGDLVMDSFVCQIEAHNEVERERNRAQHFKEFLRLAQHRDWPVTFIDGDEVNVPLPGTPSTPDEEQRIESMNEAQTYEYVKAFVDSKPGGQPEDKFFFDCYGHLNSTIVDTAQTIALRNVFFVLQFVGFFPTTEQYLTIKKHRQAMRNHAMLATCHDLQRELCRTHERMAPGNSAAHPMLTKTLVSKIISAGQQLTRLLDVPSILADGTGIPQRYVDQIVKEKQSRSDPFPAHSVEGKRRAAVTACAADLGRMRCNPNDTLALLQTSLKQFNMSLDQTNLRPRKRNAEGAVIGREGRGVLQSLTLRCKTRELQDLQLIRCPTCSASIGLKYWHGHVEAHDVATTESDYAADEWDPRYAAFVQSTAETGGFVAGGMYTEVLDGRVVAALREYVPSNDALASAYEWVRRLNAPASDDGVIALPMTYHRKHAGGFGRQWADGCSTLQRCPNVLRPLIAGKFYHDIDVVNCHPQILLGVAARSGVDVPTLHSYVADREPILASLMAHYGCSRCAAKTLILRLLNGGKPRAWKHDFEVDSGTADHDLVLELLTEVRTLRDMLLVAYPTASELLVEYNRTAAEPKTKWSAFSWALCELENRIITALETHLTGQGWQVDVLVFDGVMVRRVEDRAFTASDLRSAEAAVDAAMAEDGVVIRLEEKPMVVDPIAADWLANALET